MWTILNEAPLSYTILFHVRNWQLNIGILKNWGRVKIYSSHSFISYGTVPHKTTSIISLDMWILILEGGSVHDIKWFKYLKIFDEMVKKKILKCVEINFKTIVDCCNNFLLLIYNIWIYLWKEFWNLALKSSVFGKRTGKFWIWCMKGSHWKKFLKQSTPIENCRKVQELMLREIFSLQNITNTIHHEYEIKLRRGTLIWEIYKQTRIKEM